MVLDNIIFENATKIKTKHEFVAKGICIDNRELKKGDLFVAFKGQNFNGNSFAKKALQQGACACLVTEVENKKDLEDYPLILIKDPFEAIKQIAKYKRKIIKGKVVAITGSYGKTTSKDMINTSLKNIFNISSTYANQNNTLGAPLSLARMDLDSDLGVFEVGMNHKGEIDEIVKTLEPDIILLNEIAPLHFENFKSLQEIVDAKLEILNADKCNTFILSKDDKNYDYIVKKVAEKGIKNIISYGFDSNADFCIKKANLNGLKYDVSLQVDDDFYSFSLNTVAVHNVKIASLVLALCKALNLDLTKAIKELENFSVTKGRGNIESVSFEGKNIKVFNDSYNASGMKESIANFTKLDKKGRSVLVLGQMLELGEISAEKHKDLADSVCLEKSTVLLIGKEMVYLQKELTERGLSPYYFATLDELNSFLRNNLKQDDFVFVKGSYGSNVFKTANMLIGD